MIKKLLIAIAAAFLSASLLVPVALADETVSMFRLYNPNSGEHFYTSSRSERDSLADIGWSYEAVGWTAPAKSSAPVYRLYNPNAGDHFYTLDAPERDYLVALGWNYEGIGWYSDESRRVPMYRQYNPNAVAGSHNYTSDTRERDYLVASGWHDEDVGWYAVSGAEQIIVHYDTLRNSKSAVSTLDSLVTGMDRAMSPQDFADRLVSDYPLPVAYTGKSNVTTYATNTSVFMQTTRALRISRPCATFLTSFSHYGELMVDGDYAGCFAELQATLDSNGNVSPSSSACLVQMSG